MTLEFSFTATGLVRNELMHTDIRTGKSRSLRSHRAEEPPIDMVRVSHLKQVDLNIMNS